MDDEGSVLLLNVLKAQSRTDVTTAHVAMSGAYSIVAPSWGLSDKMFWISARTRHSDPKRDAAMLYAPDMPTCTVLSSELLSTCQQCEGCTRLLFLFVFDNVLKAC